MTVGVAIPTIPPRTEYLKLAKASVYNQTHPVDQLAIAEDTLRRGAAHTRNAALAELTTDWVCFLDDDDEFLPQHVELLLACQAETDADIVFPWFIGKPIGFDPFPEFFGLPWDNAKPRIFPITVLMRRQLALGVGGFEGQYPDRPQLGEDYHFFMKCMDAGAKIVHLPERTWIWRFHGENTSGQPHRW